jgi:predicted dehydrogenase
MIDAAIVGLGWWGKTLVESVQGVSDDIRFVAGATRTRTGETDRFLHTHQMKVADSFQALLSDRCVRAIVLATPHSLHAQQVAAAARAGKHVFCEKPLAMTSVEADAAVNAVRQTRVTLGLGYNRRFHPEMTRLRERIRSGGLGTVLHVEATMCGGLAPMGVHAIDGMIDLCGPIESVYCQSLRRAVSIDSDDTTAVLFRMRSGGSTGWVRLEGMTHVAGASSDERRTRLFGTCRFQPAKGAVETWEAEPLDVTRAALESFAVAAQGGAPFPMSLDEMAHGAAVTEAVVRSAVSGVVERVA